MFQGARLDRYQPELEQRIFQFIGNGWIKDQEITPQVKA